MKSSLFETAETRVLQSFTSFIISEQNSSLQTRQRFTSAKRKSRNFPKLSQTSFYSYSWYCRRLENFPLKIGRVIMVSRRFCPSDLMFGQFDRSPTWILLFDGKMAYYAFFIRPVVFHHFFCDWVLCECRCIVKEGIGSFAFLYFAFYIVIDGFSRVLFSDLVS